jgi:hypothetical protein
MVRRVVLAAVAAIVGMAFVMAPATAASTVTKMRLELASKEIAVGTQLGGSVSLWARSGSSWVPVMGATLSVLVDGRNMGTVVTDEGGSAVVSVPPDLTPGRHVMKIVYAGNGVYSRTQRSQGLSVTSGSEPTTCTAAPDAPVLLGADTTVLGTVTLTWSPPANDGGCPIVAYRVYRGPELVGSASGSATSYVDTAVPSGVHWYTVTAANADYVSAPSNEIFVSI